MSKKKIVILISSLIIFLGIASLATALFLPSVLATSTNSAPAVSKACPLLTSIFPASVSFNYTILRNSFTHILTSRI